MGTCFTTTSSNLKPCIYVVCLITYNNGYLHGAWIDAAQEPWTIYDEVKTMLAASPVADAEEWAIHAHEGFGGLRISEYAGFDRVSAWAEFIAKHGEIGAALLAHCDYDVEEARDAMRDRYQGDHASLADYMQELTEGTTTIPQPLRYYIDWQGMARDAEINGDVFTLTTAWDVVHVFAGC